MTLRVGKEEDGEVIEFTIAQTVMKQVPLALWGYYDPAKSPGRNKNNISDLLDLKDDMIELMMGASFKFPRPKVAEDHLVPFDWESARDTWKAPELMVDGQEDVVNVVAVLWSDGFGWSFGAGGDKELKNELNDKDGASSIVWDMFENVYIYGRSTHLSHGLE
ncbi:hypothetical protein F4782DRAFT_525312 [Xylaria castorea]|nr:hypothetical protein F4782DRAFT_525312 [Xylaria castorea]